VRTAFFWVIRQRVVINPYRRLGTTYRSLLQGSLIREDGTDILAILALEDGTDTLSRNVGKELPLLIL